MSEAISGLSIVPDRWLDLDWQYVASLYNPKDRAIYNAWLEGRHVVVTPATEYFPDLYAGDGYLGIESDGYHRSETPSSPSVDVDTVSEARRRMGLRRGARRIASNGVTEEGIGLGLMLYCALAIASWKTGGKGVWSSDKKRTPAASRWWSRQVSRGLARLVGEADEGFAEYLIWVTLPIERHDLQREVELDNRTLTPGEEYYYSVEPEPEKLSAAVQEMTGDEPVSLKWEPYHAGVIVTMGHGGKIAEQSDYEQEYKVRYVKKVHYNQRVLLDADDAAREFALIVAPNDDGETLPTRGVRPDDEFDLRLVTDPAVLDLVAEARHMSANARGVTVRLSEPQQSTLWLDVVGPVAEEPLGSEPEEVEVARTVVRQLAMGSTLRLSEAEASTLAGMVLERMNAIDDAIEAREAKRQGYGSAREARGLYRSLDAVWRKLRT